jgi:hypothetical protein
VTATLLVTLNKRHPLEVISENPRRQQAGHPAADHHGVTAVPGTAARHDQTDDS